MRLSRSLAAPLLASLIACGSAPPAGLYAPVPSDSAAVTVAPPAPSAAPPPAVVWAPFVMSDCGVSLPMPGAPKVSSDTLDAPSGKKTIHTATSDLGDRVALVSCSDVDTGSSSDATLDGARDRSVIQTHGNLIDTKNISVGGFPGRDVRVGVADKQVAIRLVLADQRLVSLVLVGFAEDDVARCLAGFTLPSKS